MGCDGDEAARRKAEDVGLWLLDIDILELEQQETFGHIEACQGNESP
jgi:hypothetical protein